MLNRFRFQVFPSSGVPLYRQIMDQVRTQIGAGLLSPGEILPSVRETAEALQINPMTVSKAYSLMERDGLLELVRGQGMRVKTPAPKGTLRERQDGIKDSGEQLVATAYQLSLSADEVREVLDPMLEQLDPQPKAKRRMKS